MRSIRSHGWVPAHSARAQLPLAANRPLAAASCATTHPVASDPDRVVVASYNVHRWTGADRRVDPGRTGEVIRELDADVVALQEVDVPRGAAREPLAALAEQLGYRAVRGPTLGRGAAGYGNALLTRLTVLELRRIDLSVPGREPRGAIVADLAAGSGRLRVIAVHLGLGVRERRRQVERLLGEIDRPGAEPVILLGDTNEWIRGVGALWPLHARLGRAPAPRTFPAARPLLPLDRIWVKPRRCLVRLAAHRSSLARVASDHLPVRSELRLAEGLRRGGIADGSQQVESLR